MRVALLTNSLPPEPGTGGAQSYVADLAEALAERDDVLVLSGGGSHELRKAAVEQIPAMRLLDSEESNLRKSIWHVREQWRPSDYKATLGALKRFDPDVVHSHELQGLSAAPYSAIARLGLPHVHTAHDLNLLCVRVSMTRDAQPCGRNCVECRLQRAIRGREIRRRLDRLIAPSEYYRRLHVEFGVVPDEQAVVVRQGAMPGTARVRPSSGPRARLGFIGVLSEHKGVNTMLEAMQLLDHDWSLFVAGDGPLAPDVAAAAAADWRIRYVGEVKGDRRDEFYDEIDVLLVPSEWEENAPLVCAEAAIRGIPSIVTDRGGLPEVPEAVVVPARSASALAAACRVLAENPDRLRSISESLIAHKDDFDWSRHVTEVHDVLSAAAARRAGAG